MAIYAIGDIQGCFDDLQRLLEKIKFDPAMDQLWFTGDLVNRGPNSLDTLRFVKSLGNSAVTVLGNHDLHLLAMGCQQRLSRKRDSLTQVLDSPDRDELLYWLRHRPLFHHNRNFCLLHAGLPPQWGFNKTLKMAQQAEKVLQGQEYSSFLRVMYGNKPDIWHSDLTGFDKIRFIINCFTRMRYCDIKGHLNFKYNCAIGEQPSHLLPWFMIPNRKSKAMSIIFGHWSTLGYYQGYNCYAIDTGCLWGGHLTALKLTKQPKRISISSDGYMDYSR